MKEIIDLKLYKKYLINYYIYPCDEIEYDQRKKRINNYYNDDFLDKVVKDTKKFILSILKNMGTTVCEESNNVFYKELISSYIYKDIYNGCFGGFNADKLICPDEYNCDFLVSMYIIEEFFGDHFKIDLVEDVREKYDEDDEIGYFDSTTYLYISGPKDKFLDIVDNDLTQKTKIIKKTNK